MPMVKTKTKADTTEETTEYIYKRTVYVIE